jgi:hypothetical protein
MITEQNKFSDYSKDVDEGLSPEEQRGKLKGGTY